MMILNKLHLKTIVLALLVFQGLRVNAQFVTFDALVDGTDYSQTLGNGDELIIEEDIIVTIDTIDGIPNTSFLATTVPQCDVPFNSYGIHMFYSGTLKFNPTNFNDTLNQVQFGYNFPCGDPFYLGIDDQDPIEISNNDIELILNNNIHIIIFNGFVSISGDFSTFKLGGFNLGLDNVNFIYQEQECRLLNLSAEISTCSNSNFNVVVNFDHTSSNDSFNLTISPIDFGNFAYSDLPITASNLPGDGMTDYTVSVTDIRNNYCELSQNIGLITCGLDQCTIENIDLNFGSCVAGFYPITIDFDHFNTIDIRFRVSSSQGELGLYRYINLPVVVDFPTSAFGDDEFIVISDVDDVNCSDTIYFTGRDCSVAPCLLNSMDVSVSECVEDSVQFLIDITSQSPGGEFIIFVNGDEVGLYPYGDLPLQVGPYPSNDTLIYSVYVEDQLFPYCNITKLLEPVICGDTSLCNIFNINVETSSCSNGLFSTEINFDYTNVNDTFVLLGNQVIYGRYGYNQLPIIIDDLVGNGIIEYEFTISAVGNHCTNEYRLGPIICPTCILEIDDVIISECINDNSVDLTLDLNYMNVGNDFVNISGPLGSFGAYLIATEPITLNYPINSEDNYIIVSVNGQPTCRDSIPLILPDCTDDVCVINEIEILSYICTEDLYDARINFTAENASDSFRIRRGTTIYGEYAYTDLPVRFGPFPGIGTIETEVIVEDIANDICSRLLTIEPQICTTVASDDVLSNRLRLYPNPATRQVQIEIPEEISYSYLSIFGINGSQIESINTSSKRIKLDVDNWTEGIYIVRILSEEGIIQKKFTVIQ